MKIYGTQANTLVDNAGVLQIFGARNYRMAQDLANLIGGISADEILRLPSDQQILLIEGKTIRCKQVRYYNDELFTSKKPATRQGREAGYFFSEAGSKLAHRP